MNTPFPRPSPRLLATALLLVAAQAGYSAAAAAAPRAKRYRLEVTGATDAAAPAKVRSAIGALPGVQKVEFDPATRMVTVTMKHDKAALAEAEVLRVLAAADPSYGVSGFGETAP